MDRLLKLNIKMSDIIKAIKYIESNHEYLKEEDKYKLVRLFKDELDLYGARKETEGIGTYIYIDKDKLPKELILKIQKFIETAIR